jgi:sarcosine oxidase, subunit delta
MMQLPCPWCGVREEVEFAYGGTAHLTRPPLSTADSEWTEYLYFRTNPKGIHLERWRHAFGCGQWFNIARNTVTHEILSSYQMTEAPPPV